jgi:hypothetical protein
MGVPLSWAQGESDRDPRVASIRCKVIRKQALIDPALDLLARLSQLCCGQPGSQLCCGEPGVALATLLR